MGQAGHKGRTLERALEPDEVVEHGLPERCEACGEFLPLADAQVAERRQVFDIPAVRYKMIEQRTLRLQCACGKLHESRFPADVSEAVQHGPNIRALAVHLTQGQLLLPGVPGTTMRTGRLGKPAVAPAPWGIQGGGTAEHKAGRRGENLIQRRAHGHTPVF